MATEGGQTRAERIVAHSLAYLFAYALRSRGNLRVHRQHFVEFTVRRFLIVNAQQPEASEVVEIRRAKLRVMAARILADEAEVLEHQGRAKPVAVDSTNVN